MNDDEPNTFLLDNDPAKLRPYSKRMIDEDPEAVTLPRAFVPSPPGLYSDQSEPGMLRFSVGRTLNWDGLLHDGVALPSGRSYQDGYR
jgi:hypothetical protein